MPLYEYRCKDCGQVFEKMLRWSESDHAPECPNCQGLNTQKQVSSFASFGTSGGNGSATGSNCGSGGRFS